MSEYFSLENEVAVITGAASGIGLETVKRFHSAGAKLVLGDLSDASELARQVDGIFLKTDVTVETEVKALMQAAVDHFGALNIVVNNAGIFADYRNLEESGESDFDSCFAVNTKGVAWGMKHAAALMEQGGRIVNTASAAATQGVIQLSSYVASKHAVIGLTKTAALEFAEKKIRVNCVCPTTVDTPMAHDGEGDYLLEAEKKLVPLGRICEATEVAALIHFLVARDCDFINGQSINIDGGFSAGTSAAIFETLLS